MRCELCGYVKKVLITCARCQKKCCVMCIFIPKGLCADCMTLEFVEKYHEKIEAYSNAAL